MLLEFALELQTDYYGYETTWNVRNFDGIVMVEGRQYEDDSLYNEFHLLESGSCYKFTIVDSVGDGMCCDWGDGSYSISYNGSFISKGGTFADFVEVAFGNC